MKINTITCHNVYNHGAILQAWALASYLKNVGHDVNIIDYQPTYLSGHFKLKVYNQRYNLPIVKWLYLLLKYPGWKKSLLRKKAFDIFSKKFISNFLTSDCYLSIDDLKRNPPAADIYIAGSDQIWNTDFKNGIDPSFYLDFGDSNIKRISYAASFATTSLREGTYDFVKTKLSLFNAISVREPSGINILNTLGYKGELVCDPVFLISSSIWSESVATNDGENENYVLVYDFEKSSEIKKVVKKIATEKKIKVYSIGSSKLDYADRCYINSGPDVFVALIKNANCVISNSFHAIAFSFIFNKDIFVVNRQDGLNTRMYDLLLRYGLVDRLIDSNAPMNLLMSHIDYSKVNKLLQIEINNSKEWLNKYIN